MKTKTLPTVDKQYKSRRNDVVVKVVDITHGDETTVWYVDIKQPKYKHCYSLDWFWDRYKNMEGEDD